MNAKKLPSGNYRCRVYIKTDSTGKKIYQSITAPSKAEAEMLASQLANARDRERISNLTVKEAVASYIESNINVLSPSTIRGYKMDANRLSSIEHLRIRKIRNVDVQNFISELSLKYSPKTIKNTYALLVTSIGFCGVDNRFKIHLPTAAKKVKYAPENDEILILLQNANPVMKKAILLAACYSLRRGEICGLTYGDIKGKNLYVHSDVVMGPNGWVHKDVPKTDTSNRTLRLNDNALLILGKGNPKEYIVPIKPETLDRNFDRLRKKVGLEHIKFHALRSYFASVAVINGIPDIYAAHMTGHKENSPVLKEHYQKKIVSMDEAYAAQMNTYFDEILKKV
jgi:integrase